MSLARLALRLAAIEALCPAANISTGPYPTLAGNQVYDSRITPIADADGWREFLASIEGQPVVTVYTEEHETDPTSGEYPADRDIVDLVVETLIASAGEIETANPDGTTSKIGSLDAAVTDAQREAALDTLEAQIRALIDPASGVSPAPYSKVARELHHVKSAPVRDGARVSRIAARTLTFKLRIAHERAYSTPPAGVDPDIAGLPEPLLTLARAVPKNSAAGQIVRQTALAIAPPPVLGKLSDVRIFSNLDRGVAPTSTTADVISDSPLSGASSNP